MELPAVVVIVRSIIGWRNKQAYECKRCQARQTLRSRRSHAAFQPAIPLLVRGHAPAHGYQGLLFRRRDTATAGAQALPAHMGNGQ